MVAEFVATIQNRKIILKKDKLVWKKATNGIFSGKSSVFQQK